MKTVYSDKSKEKYGFLEKPVENVTLAFQLVGDSWGYPSVDEFCKLLENTYAAWVYRDVGNKRRGNKVSIVDSEFAGRLIKSFIKPEGAKRVELHHEDLMELAQDMKGFPPTSHYPLFFVKQLRREWDINKVISLSVSARMAFFEVPEGIDIDSEIEKKYLYDKIEQLGNAVSNLEDRLGKYEF